jgi:acetyl-CoA/propionyl-CoA carboxylase biotin carboxyl carrier protein
VTELVYGLDLVEWQLRVAAGEALPFSSLEIGGHAVEARVYAEDPARGFLPTGGTVLGVRSPAGPGIRVDSGLAPGVTVTSDYDPMLAKVAAWGPDRATALQRLDAALASTAVLGVGTNVSFLRELLADPDVQAGRLDTGLVERIAAAANHQAAAADHETPGAEEAPDISRNFRNLEAEALAAAALARVLALEPAGAVVDPWAIPDGWRPGERAWTKFRLSHGTGADAEVRVRGLASAGAEVAVGDGDPVRARAELRPAGPRDGQPGGELGTDLVLTYAGRTVRFAYATAGGPAGPVTWLARDGFGWAITDAAPVALRGSRAGSADGTIRSPMPGTVLVVHVTQGQAVTAGQPVLVVEAMKMEHTVIAPVDGVVAELTAKAGQQVSMDETLAVIGTEVNGG